jgi:hypothetical protein
MEITDVTLKSQYDPRVFQIIREHGFIPHLNHYQGLINIDTKASWWDDIPLGDLVGTLRPNGRAGWIGHGCSRGKGILLFEEIERITGLNVNLTFTDHLYDI